MKQKKIKAMVIPKFTNRQECEEHCNNFLKSRFGLQYLLLKYPNHSLEVAISEFKKMAQKIVINNKQKNNLKNYETESQHSRAYW